MRIAVPILVTMIIGIGALQFAGPAPADSAPDNASPGHAILGQPAQAAAATTSRCGIGPTGPAVANAASLETLKFAPFRRPETGWSTYALRIAAEIATPCGPVTPGFAAALARWQRAHGLPPSGIVDVDTFAAMNARWTAQRPFVAQAQGGDCPAPPPPAMLAVARVDESFGGKQIEIRSEALAAYRRMIAAARHELPDVKRGDRWFRIFSGFRAPDADAARCAIEDNCQGVVRASCSAHRTGTAIDIDVGSAPGFPPDSSDDANRRFMAATPVYAWLVRNAARYGFVNYVFEPWHWEWHGAAAPIASLDSAALPRQ